MKLIAEIALKIPIELGYDVVYCLLSAPEADTMSINQPLKVDTKYVSSMPLLICTYVSKPSNSIICPNSFIQPGWSPISSIKPPLTSLEEVPTPILVSPRTSYTP
jgi:hypothetical protein